MQPQLIFITGFMGSGKTTVGRKLADSLGFAFVDLDTEIFNATGKSIPQLFRNGEDFFRMTEKTVLLNLLHTLSANTVVALGGGTVCFYDNLRLVKSKGRLIFLEVNPEVIYSRLSNEIQKRPLLANIPVHELPHFIRTSLEARMKYYQQADFTVNAQGTADEIAETIAALPG